MATIEIPDEDLPHIVEFLDTAYSKSQSFYKTQKTRYGLSDENPAMVKFKTETIDVLRRLTVAIEEASDV